MKTPRIELAHFIATESQKASLPKSFAGKLAGYLLAEHRSGELESIMHDVMAMRFESGLIEATVSSVNPLSAETKTKITQLIKRRYPKAKKVSLVEIADPSLIGGVTIQLPNERLDLSVAGRILFFRRAVAERVAV
jgi:F0F1-type ATP synthase delta subunit